MKAWLIIGFSVLLAAGLTTVMYCLLIMASRGDRQLEKLDQAQPDHGTCPAAPPAPEGYIWCPTCQAMFADKLCPGCTPDEASEAGYYPGSLSDPRD
jgi:hypothetical protein